MVYRAFIFDLDGTLLDTLPDLVRLTNMVLELRGWPERSREQILSYVGNGGRSLLSKAAPPSTSDEEVDAAFAQWRELYPEYGHALTRPYAGMPEALVELKGRGAKLGVLSNKFDGAVRQVIAEHFPGLFDIARGECAEIPRKPDPRGLRYMMDWLGVEPEEAVYVGDSPSDMVVAANADVCSVGVSWGYRPADDLRAAGARVIVDRPMELANLRP